LCTFILRIWVCVFVFVDIGDSGDSEHSSPRGQATLVFDAPGQQVWVASRRQREALGRGVSGVSLLRPVGEGKYVRPFERPVFEDIDEEAPHFKHEDFNGQELKEAVQLCHRVLHKTGKLVVYCSGGMARSPSVVCALLMAKNQWTFEQAKAKLLKERASATAPGDKPWATRIVKSTQETLRSMTWEDFVERADGK
jgi:hypothetical protein